MKCRGGGFSYRGGGSSYHIDIFLKCMLKPFSTVTQEDSGLSFNGIFSHTFCVSQNFWPLYHMYSIGIIMSYITLDYNIQLELLEIYKIILEN